MADRTKTIGTSADYADPILWAAAQGGISDGDRAVGELISDVTMTALFRPNQSFPNGGLLKGDTVMTGEIGVGRTLANTAATRFCLAPTDGVDFQDFWADDGAVSKTYVFQNLGSSACTRVISGQIKTTDITLLADKDLVLDNCVFGGMDAAASTTAGTVTATNCLFTERLIIRQENLLTFKDSISQATDWLLGKGTYTGSDTLVNYCKFLQNAAAGDFGTGSSNYTVNVDSDAEFVDLSGGDYRIESASSYATAGDGGGLLGPFLEVSSGSFQAAWANGSNVVINGGLTNG